MTIDTIIMFLGLFVAILPHLGIPAWIDTYLLAIAGACIIMFGIVIRRRRTRRARAKRAGEVFVENAPRYDSDTHDER